MPFPTYDVATETANGIVNIDILARQIEGAGITTGLPLKAVNQDGGSEGPGRGQVTGGTVTLVYTSTPDPADRATLSMVIATHQGEAFGDPVQRLTDDSVSNTTANTPQVKIGGTAAPAIEGEYQIIWYCEIRLQAIVAGSGVRGSIVASAGAPTEIAEDNWDLDQWHAFSGTFSIMLKAGDTPMAEIQFQRIGALNTVEIRRARLTLIQGLS